MKDFLHGAPEDGEPEGTETSDTDGLSSLMDMRIKLTKAQERIAELEEQSDRSMSVCPHLTISGSTKGMNRVYCASCNNEYWIPSKALQGVSDE